MTRFIIGVDWLRKQGHFVWDFENNRIKFSDGGWIDFRREDSVRRVFESENISLPFAQQTNADDDDDDADEGRINFNVAFLRLQGHVTISLNSEVT